MNKMLFTFLLSFAFSLGLQAAQDPVPVQIPESELAPDVIIEPAEVEQSEKGTESKEHSILKPDSQPVAEEIPAPAPQPVAEEIPAPAPQPIGEEMEVSTPELVSEELPVSEEIPDSTSQPIQSSSGLIPFNPSGSVHEVPDSVPGYAVTAPAGLLASVFQKYQFPYAFIRVEVLNANVESQPINDQLVQMQLPLVVSFETESFAAFQAELESVLEMISANFQNELTQLRPVQARKGMREGVTLNVPDGAGNYKAYELPKECREVLAQYAALVPVGKVTLYDGKETGLQNWYFPLLYRDIVKAFPINLLEVYQGDFQTIRILEHQNEPFMDFIQTQGHSFVIPENFHVVLSYTASANFLEKQAKIYYLEPVFRRPELLPQILMTLEMQVPVNQFRNIRFMNCEIMTDRPGETVVKPTEEFVLQEEETENSLTEADLKTQKPEEAVKSNETVTPGNAQSIIEEEVSEELPFVLEEAPAQ